MTLLDSRSARGAEALGVEVIDEGGLLVALPRDEPELVALVARAARERWRLVPVGLGSILDACRPEARTEPDVLAVSTRRVDAVVEYEPGDGTVSAQAGVRMDALADAVRAGGHRLTPDVPCPSRATLGGVLGASLSGPDRLRYGPVRHHVLGTRVLLADGSTSRSGGKLVKNVTGFDLHRLYCGSRGTLCVLLEASMRLFPEPQRELVLSRRAGGPREGIEAALRVTHGASQGLAPLAVTLVGAGGTWTLSVCLAGRDEQVRWERDQVTALLGECDEQDATDEPRARLRDESRDGGGLPTFRLTSQPSRIASGIDVVRSFCEARNTPVRLVVQPGIACADVFVEMRADDGRVEAALDLRERLAPGEVRIDPFGAPLAVHRALGRREGEDPARRWSEALRHALDPQGMFSWSGSEAR